MGLFSSKPKANFLEIIGIQINTHLNSEIVKGSSKEGFTDYYLKIKDNFNLFSGVIIRIFGTELDLSGKSTFNLLFIENEEEDSPISKMKELINVISNEFGKDRRGKGKWSSEDENRITSFWEGREWILDKKGKTYKEFGSGMSQANLLFNIDSKSGVEFSILQANNLL